MGFDTLEQCIEANKDLEDDPKGYCIMKFPKLEKTAVLVSPTNVSTNVQPILCKKGGDLAACKQSEITKKTANLKMKVAIAYLKKKRGKVAASGDSSTSQAEGSPDGPHFTLKKIKREGFPEGRGTKERVGIMKLASQDQDFAKYYLLDSQDTNGNGWGVTEDSIDKNINSFVDMPFVITDREWIHDSEYEDYDHPSVETNDLRQIFAHQERFRVATIVKIAKDDDDGRWYAMIKRNPKFAHLALPPFCSPALYMTDSHEPDDHITKWFGLHLAGLTRDPAYGPRVALFKGTCTGSMGSCSTQLRMAKSDTLIKPVEMIDQSGLDITETDKKASPFEEEQEIKISKLKTKLAIYGLKQRINRL